MGEKLIPLIMVFQTVDDVHFLSFSGREGDLPAKKGTTRFRHVGMTTKMKSKNKADINTKRAGKAKKPSTMSCDLFCVAQNE